MLKTGVKQDDGLSSTLFNLELSKIISVINPKGNTFFKQYRFPLMLITLQ